MPRGRPRQPESAATDEAIGHACAQLMHWGWPGRGAVFNAVARAALTVFGRRLGAERVKQLYDAWVSEARPLGYTDPGRITKARRVAQRPAGPIDDHALKLLREHRAGGLAQLRKRTELLKSFSERASMAELRTVPWTGSDPLDPKVMREHRAGGLAQLRRRREPRKSFSERTSLAEQRTMSWTRPDPLDDPKWRAVGGGMHPDDMNVEQRAAFDALSPADKARYQSLVDEDVRENLRIEAERKEQQERWRTFDGFASEPLAEIRGLVGEDGYLYVLPGFLDGGVPTLRRRGRVKK